jgi:hypothetical protein
MTTECGEGMSDKVVDETYENHHHHYNLEKLAEPQICKLDRNTITYF